MKAISIANSFRKCRIYNGPYQTMLHLVFLLAPQIAFSRCCQATTAHIKRFLVHKLNLVGNTMRLEIFTTGTGGITSKITLLIISRERINAQVFILKKDSYPNREVCNQNDSHHINHLQEFVSRDKMGDFRKNFLNYINNTLYEQEINRRQIDVVALAKNDETCSYNLRVVYAKGWLV